MTKCQEMEDCSTCLLYTSVKGMTQLAKETGITRDELNKALSPTGNPSFDTVQKVIKAFGLRLGVEDMV